MHLYSPERKRIGERPALIWDEKPIPAVVPVLNVMPREEEEGAFDIEVCICIAPNTARWLSTKRTVTGLGVLLHNYTDNPEDVLRRSFGWHYMATAAVTSKTFGKELLTLADLGL